MKNVDLMSECYSIQRDYGLEEGCDLCEHKELCKIFEKKNVDPPWAHMDYVESLTDEFLNAEVTDERISSVEDMIQVEMTESEYRQFLEWQKVCDMWSKLVKPKRRRENR